MSMSPFWSVSPHPEAPAEGESESAASGKRVVSCWNGRRRVPSRGVAASTARAVPEPPKSPVAATITPWAEREEDRVRRRRAVRERRVVVEACILQSTVKPGSHTKVTR